MSMGLLPVDAPLLFLDKKTANDSPAMNLQVIHPVSTEDAPCNVLYGGVQPFGDT